MTGISRETTGNALIVCLNNPRRLNVLDTEMLEKLAVCFEEAERSRQILALVLCGAGDKAFCAGADIKCWASMSPFEFTRDWVRLGHRTFDRLARLSKPTVAAVNGVALGGGLELAAACDLRVVAPHAELGLPEARIGIVPGWSGTQRLARLLPEPVIKEMALFGRRLSAQKALELGFAAEIAEDPVAAAVSIAAELDNLSSRSAETAKAMIHAGAGEDAAASIDALAGAAMAATPDNKEGVAAFRDKRPARFTNR